MTSEPTPGHDRSGSCPLTTETPPDTPNSERKGTPKAANPSNNKVEQARKKKK